MKKKIGEIYNKPIVIGDKNLMTKNEVHKDEISGGSKEYDDLHTFLYYDDRIVSVNGVEMPLCSAIALVISNLRFIVSNVNTIVKINNTEDVLGMNLGNYIPLEKIKMDSSGIDEEILLINGISIPKYVLPENIIATSGFSDEVEKLYIFDLFDEGMKSVVEFLKTQPTITREEFFDLLK